jgi:hypothetical protein
MGLPPLKEGLQRKSKACGTDNGECSQGIANDSDFRRTMHEEGSGGHEIFPGKDQSSRTENMICRPILYSNRLKAMGRRHVLGRPHVR